MKARFVRRAAWALGAVCGAALALAPALAAPKKEFKIAWSVFAGYMPLSYAASSGVMKKWADKYGVAVELVQVNDYVDSVKQYAAGAFDACPMTNMDALTIPAAGGVDSTAIFVIDFSNGADGVVLKDGADAASLKGRTVHLVEFSVSHYLLARALEHAKLSEKDVTIVNASATEIVSLFAKPGGATAAVTWNPQLSMAAAAPGAVEVFSTRQIPGEIIDLMVVNTETLKDNPALGRALTGAWYEIMDLVAAGGEAILGDMGWASGTDAQGFKAQLATLKMFYTPADALAFATGDQLPKTMDLVRSFSFEHGLLGEAAKSKDAVGIAFPGGTTLGDPNNVKLRFDAEVMRLAAENKL